MRLTPADPWRRVYPSQALRYGAIQTLVLPQLPQQTFSPVFKGVCFLGMYELRDRV